MPAPPLVLNVYQVTTFGTLYGHACDHVINWFSSGGTGGPHVICQDLAQADHDRWMGHMAAVLSPSYIYTKSKAVYLGDLSILPAEVFGPIPGTDSGARLPAFTAVTMRHSASVRGRGKDGRTNIPNPAVSSMDTTNAFNLTGGAVSFYQGFMTAYLSDVAADVLAAHGNVTQLVILDRKLGTYNRPVASQIDPYFNVHRRWAKRLARH